MIELIGVTAGYGRTDIIKNINVTFKKNKITSIIGPNGCGKTTLLKTMSRLINPVSGSVLFEGKGIEQFSPKQLAQKIAMLPQIRNAANVNVYNLIMHGRFPYSGFSRKPSEKDKQIVNMAMELTKTYDLKEKNILQISGGERQRVYIAMSIAQDTDVILLDEPTTHLDIYHQMEIIDLIKNLNKNGKTIIMVMHDISQAMMNSNLVCVMNNGNVLCCCEPDYVYEKKYIEEAFKINCRQNIINSDIFYSFSK
ncbi:MAG: ABC transporter ATP-binding protein [Eubacteriaceae bacterium]